MIQSENFKDEYNTLLNDYIRDNAKPALKESGSIWNEKYSIDDFYLSENQQRINKLSRVSVALKLVEGLGAKGFDQNNKRDQQAKLLLDKVLNEDILTDREIKQIAHAIKGGKSFNDIEG